MVAERSERRAAAVRAAFHGLPPSVLPEQMLAAIIESLQASDGEMRETLPAT